MGRIVRAEAGWEDAVSRAVGDSTRPIPLDERFLPRNVDGEAFRSRYDRASFPPARAAATLLAIYPDATGRLVIPITIRRDELRAHAGEVSLPGGAVEATDADVEAAALREAWEEIALEPAIVRVVGRLDPVWIPVSNFELVPVVGTVATRPSLVPQDSEVAAIVELPLEALHDEEVIGVEEFSARGITLRAGAYRYGGVRVWGATAITLGMLARVLDDA
ncbi:MAG TPA: CoA pyrophosphatase [Candidatus Limnocylindria bacterium]|jgi:8-oxo-dGTP pyrophosphatase MutT (NUDIX family)